jgi:hypothetical protein
MTTLERLAAWVRDGVITDAQHDALVALVRKDRFSVYLELNAFLYAGVLSIAAGLLWTTQKHFAALGDVAIVLTLTAIVGGCFAYCFMRAQPYSSGEVESPTMAFDYLLYLGCVVFGIELGYIETRFELLRAAWDVYVLLSAVVFFAAAYRFDNRLVLSLALSTLAAWFGIKLTRLGYSSDSLRVSALVYGALVAAMGGALYRVAIKQHFIETHLHVAAAALFVALLSGVGSSNGPLYLVGLNVLGVCAVAAGIRYRRFPFVAYGVVYPYLGISFRIARVLPGATSMLLYVLVSGSAVVLLMVYVARRVGRDA